MKDRICFTGSNLIEISEFLAGYHFEYTGDKFIIPSPVELIVLNKGDSLIKEDDGTLSMEHAVAIWPTNELKVPEPSKVKKTRGKKK